MLAWENNSKWLCSELKQLRRVITTCERTLNVLWVFEELKLMLPFSVTQIFYSYILSFLFFSPFSLAAEVSFSLQQKSAFSQTSHTSPTEPIMANTNAMWQQAVHITTNYQFLSAQQKPYKRA